MDTNPDHLTSLALHVRGTLISVPSTYTSFCHFIPDHNHNLGSVGMLTLCPLSLEMGLGLSISSTVMYENEHNF